MTKELIDSTSSDRSCGHDPKPAATWLKPFINVFAGPAEFKPWRDMFNRDRRILLARD